jgi:hypothetical protein
VGTIWASIAAVGYRLGKLEKIQISSAPVISKEVARLATKGADGCEREQLHPDPPQACCNQYESELMTSPPLTVPNAWYTPGWKVA